MGGNPPAHQRETFQGFGRPLARQRETFQGFGRPLARQRETFQGFGKLVEGVKGVRGVSAPHRS